MFKSNEREREKERERYKEQKERGTKNRKRENREIEQRKRETQRERWGEVDREMGRGRPTGGDVLLFDQSQDVQQRGARLVTGNLLLLL